MKRAQIIELLIKAGFYKTMHRKALAREAKLKLEVKTLKLRLKHRV